MTLGRGGSGTSAELPHLRLSGAQRARRLAPHGDITISRATVELTCGTVGSARHCFSPAAIRYRASVDRRARRRHHRRKRDAAYDSRSVTRRDAIWTRVPMIISIYLPSISRMTSGAYPVDVESNYIVRRYLMPGRRSAKVILAETARP